MIDIHTHVLPAVDDGAGSLEVAVEMCRMAADDGCTVMLATPHQRTPTWWNSEPGDLDRGLEDLRTAVGDSPELRLGAEIRVDSRLLDALADVGESGVLALAGSRYLLLELDRRGFGRLDPEALTHELRLQDWTPIFAHPEFIPGLANEPETMAAIVRTGGLFQITAMSLTGDFGRRIRKISERMVAAGLIHFVASDAHDLARRPPGLQRVHTLLTETFGADLANRLTFENPQAILENRPIAGAHSRAC